MLYIHAGYDKIVKVRYSITGKRIYKGRSRSFPATVNECTHSPGFNQHCIPVSDINDNYIKVLRIKSHIGISFINDWPLVPIGLLLRPCFAFRLCCYGTGNILCFLRDRFFFRQL